LLFRLNELARTADRDCRVDVQSETPICAKSTCWRIH
jgi:hypothetical protein